ncbi:DUF711 family protein [Psychromonas sp. PT13]|uniref:DUF711 family protein n=1 Tax=Psychromonas sp. PT13 TaxID=3439547 RepID=UPI003EBE6F82
MTPLRYQNKALCKVRTVTTFISLDADKSRWNEQILEASQYCLALTDVFDANGYEVQSIRIVTNPFGEYLNTSSYETARADLQYLRELLMTANHSDMRVRFAIGEAQTLNELLILPELIKEFGDLCNVCVNISLDEFGILDNTMIEQSVQAVQRIAAITPRGEGNFNFTVNFNCQPLIPYFPASYHRKELGNKVVIGLETPDLLVDVLKQYNQEKGTVEHNSQFNGYYHVMHQALQYHIDMITDIVKKADISDAFEFAGFDSSAAPSKNCASMTDVYEAMGVPHFGASGTVEASALLTRVFKSISGVDLVGFSGLMLALTEDRGLAKGSINGDFDIRSLLTYSAVCGIGLDTVPIPGDTPADKIAAIMRDTGTMAYRLNKPLTVRLFPVPGLKAGELTAFESDDLCNCAVLAVP